MIHPSAFSDFVPTAGSRAGGTMSGRKFRPGVVPGAVMRRCFIFAVVFAALAWSAGFARGGERIEEFSSLLEVRRNGELLVTETIRVQAEGDEIKHGIFREIPMQRKGLWGLKKQLPFDVLSVKLDGKPEPYEAQKSLDGMLKIKIGRDAVHLKPGVHTYEIVYRTLDQIYVEKDRDVLYWNVNGTEWGFPADVVKARMVLPDGIAISNAWAFTGKRGERGNDCRAGIHGNTADFETTRPFAPKENLTIVVEWPPRLLDPAAYANRGFWKEYPGAAAGIACMAASFFYYLVAWMLVGKDPEKGTIIPRWEPPKGFSPAAVRFLSRMGFDNTCFTAGVLGLAVKGVAEIEQDGKHYTLKKIHGDTSKLLPDEHQLFRDLLGNRSSLALRQHNHSVIGKARKALKKTLALNIEKIYFLRNVKWWIAGVAISLAGLLCLLFPDGHVNFEVVFIVVWLSIWSAGTGMLLSSVIRLWRSGSYFSAVPMMLFSIPFVGGWLLGCAFFYVAAGPWALGAFVLAGVMNAVFHHLIKAPTRLGRRIMDESDGFKLYLSVAEEERLNLLNPPEKTPELFERFLPYALALGCEQNWAKKFDDILKAASVAETKSGGGGYHPTFFTGSYTGMDDAMSAAALGAALTGALASASSAPSSSGGGGGFSGGGGGGGGGGGW
jgi:uncharacterized membrane protein YgcG